MFGILKALSGGVVLDAQMKCSHNPAVQYIIFLSPARQTRRIIRNLETTSSGGVVLSLQFRLLKAWFVVYHFAQPRANPKRRFRISKPHLQLVKF